MLQNPIPYSITQSFTKFYLNTNQWDKVVTATQQIIDLGYYELFPDFIGLFRVENEGNKEMVVAWPSLVDQGVGNLFPNGTFPPGLSYSPKLPGFQARI